MDEQESKDLEVMKVEIQKIKISSFEYLCHLAEMNDVDLSHCGHRYGQARAVLDSLNKAKKRIKVITREYLRKYPDEK